jgi:DNA repair protein RecO (recombination protein O)
MNQLNTQAIVLSRTDFGEADRILTLLTPDYGKLRLMARGVRKVKSKLAGGIELFSVSHVTFIQGRGEIGTLISARLDKHYGHIVENIERTMLGYELIKLLSRTTEDEPEAAYFDLLKQTFAALDDNTINLELIRLWFAMQLLAQAGHAPNLQTDDNNVKLASDTKYNFNFEAVAFTPANDGRFTASDIKFLRLGFGQHSPKTLQNVAGIAVLIITVTPLVQTMLQTHVRV